MPNLISESSTIEAALLTAEAVSKQVDGPEGSLSILTNINLAVQAGESVAIVGASGSGKSTLLGLLAGLDLPTAGKIRIADAVLTEADEDGRAAARAAHVGFVFQNFQLLPALTAEQNVLLPLELAGHGNAKELAQKALSHVGLDKRGKHYPQQLSGGEQQRVALARAFAKTPEILFADEPTGNLDSRTSAQIVELLFSMNQQQGTTLILVTHDLNLAARCDRQLTLEAGELSETQA